MKRNDERLVKAIKKCQIDRGYTNKELALRLDICDNTLRNKLKVPNKFTLKELRILYKLGVFNKTDLIDIM